MIKVGIIGSGFGLYGLLPAFNSTPGCKVVSICGKKSERLVNYCKSIGLENIYTDWQEMLEREDLDGLAIAVTPNAQYKIIKVAIKKGLHILAEKPLALNYKQSKELEKLAQKKKVINAVDFIFPEIEQWQKVKELLSKKKYGKLKQVHVNWDLLSFDIRNKRLTWKSELAEGGGAVSYYFSHTFYYLEHFAGKINKLKSDILFSKDKREVGVNLLLDFADGVKGVAHLNSNTPGLNKHELKFICENATIILENENSYTDNFNLTIYHDGKIKKVLTKNEKFVNNEDERVKIVRKISKRFIKSISKDERFIPSFNEGARVQYLIDAVRSGKSNV